MTMEPMQVAVRLRPLVPNEINTGCRPCIEKVRGQPQIIVGNSQQFTYNYVFDDGDGQMTIYQECVQPLIQKLFEGYNVTILAYGQTGTGKTYTMGTNYCGVGEMGIIPRAIIEIFQQIDQSKEKCEVSVSFLELYNEILYDLLTLRDRSQSVVEIRETGNQLVIPGLTQKTVTSVEKAMQVLHEGSSLRVTGATAMNATSSRSHAVFTVTLKITPINEPKNSVLSKFHLVDLAGSERAKKTCATADRLKEGININRGLLHLGNVISQLGSGACSYINYRDSKLTRLLQDSLGGNSYTLMIACVSPADSNQEESICTLRYADRVRKIKNKPIVNMDPQAALITQLKKEVEELRLQIISPSYAGTGSCPPSHLILEERVKAEMKRNAELSQALKSALHQNPAIYERSLMIENISEKTKNRLAELLEVLDKAVEDPTTTSFQDLCSMVRSIQGDLVQTERDIIDKSKREQEEEDIIHNSEENHLEPPDDVREQHVLFQAKTNKQIEDITKNLLIKQDLCEKLLRNNGQIAQLNESEHSVEYLTNLVKKLESEKQQLIFKSRLDKSKQPDTNTPDNIKNKLHHVEAELRKTQKKLVEQEKMLKFKAKSDEKIVALRKEIQSMKAMKVQLIHQMKAENDRFRNWQNEKNREVFKLKNLNAKKDNMISKMEKEFALRQAVLRRKLEAAAAAKKRMEQAFDKRNDTNLKKAAQDFEPGKLEQYITAEIDVHESISWAKHSLQNLLDDRASLMKEIHSLEGILQNQKNGLSPEELASCEKKKTILEQELQLQSTQIADLQQQIINSRQDERKKQRWDGIKSVTEAKHALTFLFNSVSKSKKDIMNLNDVTKELKSELEEKVKELEELQRTLHSSEKKNKKECDAIVRDYEDKIYAMFNQRNFSTVDDKENELDMTFTEPEKSDKKVYVDINKYSLGSAERRLANKANLTSYELEYLKFREREFNEVISINGVPITPVESENKADDDDADDGPPSAKKSKKGALDQTFVIDNTEKENLHNSSFKMPKISRTFFD